jgi:hypothetical protein
VLSLLTGSLMGPAIAIAAVAAAFGFGFYKGDVHRGQVDGTAGAQRQIEFLQKQVAARDAAAKADAAAASAGQTDLADQLERANAAIKKFGPGACLDSADVGRLRHFWNLKHGKN